MRKRRFTYHREHSVPTFIRQTRVQHIGVPFGHNGSQPRTMQETTQSMPNLLLLATPPLIYYFSTWTKGK